jgi:hypothetical protein
MALPFRSSINDIEQRGEEDAPSHHYRDDRREREALLLPPVTPPRNCGRERPGHDDPNPPPYEKEREVEIVLKQEGEKSPHLRGCQQAGERPGQV